MDRIGRAMHERDEPARASRTRSGCEQVRPARSRWASSGRRSPTASPPSRTPRQPWRTSSPRSRRSPPGWTGAGWRRAPGCSAGSGRTPRTCCSRLSLVGGYRFGGPTDLLVATGGLTGGQTRRRLAETQKWGAALTDPGSLVPVTGEGWRLTVHVRLMHALVNAAFEDRWDTEQWGLPINQADQASTLGLFDGVLIIGSRALGVPISGRESRDLMHLWRYVGRVMGVHEDFLVDDEWKRHHIDYHVLLAQGPLTEAGPQARAGGRRGPGGAALPGLAGTAARPPGALRARAAALHAHRLPRSREHARARPADAPAVGARLPGRAQLLALPRAAPPARRGRAARALGRPAGAVAAGRSYFQGEREDVGVLNG
ncbi:DUF2236 domain-containing protein [Nocardioides sp. W3-2-3]|uniref:oxygenase MpaB family protein n=1 Tax=Nocardioides convexus TaxID=2712224 RepID=UPI002418898D|nr:oxygenase MpaB family protein [Nocardioides convexus]NHA00382.1 DUF2236 domain-containing protein [Nocardioides convexus]